MIFKAILRNKNEPGYGQATIPFPIPGSEYDHTIGLLEAINQLQSLDEYRVLLDAGSYVIANDKM